MLHNKWLPACSAALVGQRIRMQCVVSAKSYFSMVSAIQENIQKFSDPV